MKQKIYSNYGELSHQTAIHIAELISKKPDALLCFPAGETSIGTYKKLIEIYKAGKVSFLHCRIIGLDEWVNLNEMRNENCHSFLNKHFFDHIDYSPRNMCFFDGESSDLDYECRKTDNFIQEYGPIDMILLGAGMNGHLGLNEPGSSFHSYSHVVNLHEITKTIGQKYFTQNIALKKGITIGMRQIIESKEMILQLSGKHKAGLVKMLIESDISPDFPVSIIKSHLNAYLLLDQEASGGIKI